MIWYCKRIHWMEKGIWYSGEDGVCMLSSKGKEGV